MKILKLSLCSFVEDIEEWESFRKSSKLALGDASLPLWFKKRDIPDEVDVDADADVGVFGL